MQRAFLVPARVGSWLLGIAVTCSGSGLALAAGNDPGPRDLATSNRASADGPPVSTKLSDLAANAIDHSRIDTELVQGSSCPWDCADPLDGDVGIVDFLALLAEWGMVGTPCDFDGGGVGIVDFLKLLANWGPCPEPQVNFFLGTATFDDAVGKAGKLLKLKWNFNPHALGPASEVAVPDPLDINTHADSPSDPWTLAPMGTDLWPPQVDNIRFTSNLNPQGALNPGNNLAFATLGFSPDIANDILRETTNSGSIDVISGPPAGDNHTAMAFRITGTIIGSRPGLEAVLFHVTVYDKQDAEIGKITIDSLNGTTVFVGFVTTDPKISIGRVDVWDSNGSSEGISFIWAYQHVPAGDG